MKLRKAIIDIDVILLAFLLFVIWHQSFLKNSTEASSSSLKYYKVYLITPDKELEHWGSLNQGAADMAEMLGINYIWDAPQVSSAEQQIDIINKAVDNDANALLIAADDPKQISGAIEDAKAKEVKIIYVDSPAFEEAITTLATDNYDAGVQAGRTMISILESKGIGSGSISIINLAAKANTKLREDGFRSVLGQDGRYKLLETVYIEHDSSEIAQREAESVINNNEDLVALFGTSEGTSIGIGKANKSHNNQFIGVGFDNTPIMQKLLQDGSLKAIINQNRYTMGYLGMAQAVAAILGKDTGPNYINTGVTVINNY